MRRSILLFFFLFCAIIVYGIKPDRGYIYTPRDFQLKYEEYHIKTIDSHMLNSWHIMPQDSVLGCTIIISYGDVGNMASGLYLAAALVRNGFDIWLYDYRGFGKSDDFEMSQDRLYYTEFTKDLSAVINKAKITNPKNKICLLGLSMGTIVNALYYHEYPDNVDFYIGEGLVYSPEVVVGRIKETRPGKEITLPPSNVHLEQIYANMKIPVLLFFASDDIVCNNDDLVILKQKIKNMKIINYEGGHLSGLTTLREQYVQYLTEFLINMK